MDMNRRKEQFSDAFVRAAAAVAGFATSKPSVDDDSVDWVIHQAGGQGAIRSPRLELQLKCTASPDSNEAGFRYHLSLKNYIDLSAGNLMVPRILVLVVVPMDIDNWLRMTDEHLVLRNCAYWASLRGLPQTSNSSSVLVELPRASRFDAKALDRLMTRVGAGEPP
jgi:hypothetical protein